MNKKDFFNEIQRELCKGKSSCEFEAKCEICVKNTRGNDRKQLSPLVFGKLICADNEECIIIKQLGINYSWDNDTVFTIDKNNFVYDNEYRIIIITDTLKEPDSNGFGIIIKLQDIKIK